MLHRRRCEAIRESGQSKRPSSPIAHLPRPCQYVPSREDWSISRNGPASNYVARTLQPADLGRTILSVHAEGKRNREEQTQQPA